MRVKTSRGIMVSQIATYNMSSRPTALKCQPVHQNEDLVRFLCSRRYTGVFDDEEGSVGHDGTMGRRSYVDDSKLINRRS